MDIFEVILTTGAERDLTKVPLHIAEKFQTWLDLVENEGLRESRKIKSYHDEPLKGKRKGQRSIRLSKAYRAIYVEKNNGKIEFIEVREVNKHDY
jgi:proteic killer suppression protein